MNDASKLPTLLPHRLPSQGDARQLLFALRRMAVHGIDDAFATHSMLTAFGMRYRQPLVLLRALLVEMAREAKGNVVVAPCCAPRMTADEHNILVAIADPDKAQARLADTLGTELCTRTVDTAHTLSVALDAMGRRLSL